MKIKIILTLFLFNFVGVKSRSHGGKGDGKMDNLEEVCQIKQKLRIIQEEMKKLRMNYDFNNLFVIAKASIMQEAFNNILSVKATSLTLFNNFNDKKYGKIQEKLQNAKLMEDKKLYDMNYLTGVFIGCGYILQEATELRKI